MANNFGKNWTTNNNNYPLDSKEVERYLSVKPSENQLTLVDKPFYTFMHFGMNTATDREWGAGVEKASDFTIKSINAKQWVDTAKQAGATGVILTCKHTTASAFGRVNTQISALKIHLITVIL